jgi:hypothetical protein
MIKTRTVVQIRTHAQKYFLKLNKVRPNRDSQQWEGDDMYVWSQGNSNTENVPPRERERSTNRTSGRERQRSARANEAASHNQLRGALNLNTSIDTSSSNMMDMDSSYKYNYVSPMVNNNCMGSDMNAYSTHSSYNPNSGLIDYTTFHSNGKKSFSDEYIKGCNVTMLLVAAEELDMDTNTVSVSSAVKIELPQHPILERQDSNSSTISSMSTGSQNTIVTIEKPSISSRKNSIAAATTEATEPSPSPSPSLVNPNRKLFVGDDRSSSSSTMNKYQVVNIVGSNNNNKENEENDCSPRSLDQSSPCPDQTDTEISFSNTNDVSVDGDEDIVAFQKDYNNKKEISQLYRPEVDSAMEAHSKRIRI